MPPRDQLPCTILNVRFKFHLNDISHVEFFRDEGGMGDEMEAAYEEFLQKQPLMQGYQPPHLAGRPEQSVLPPIHQIISVKLLLLLTLVFGSFRKQILY